MFAGSNPYASANTTSSSPSLERRVTSSRSSVESTFCSPDSNTSRAPLSSGDSSPPDGLTYDQAGDGSDEKIPSTLSGVGGGGSAIGSGSGGSGEPTRSSVVHPDRHFAVLPNERAKQAYPSFTDVHKVMASTTNRSPVSSFVGHASSSSGSTSRLDVNERTIEQRPTAAVSSSSIRAANPIPVNSASSSNSSKTERHASKSRRMSPGGSRMPSEDAGDRRNGLGRSASDSGSEWHHGVKAQHAVAASAADTQSASSRAAGHALHDGDPSDEHHTSHDVLGTASSPQSSPARPHMDLAAFPPQDLLRILAALLHQIATANDQLRPRGGSNTGSGAGQTETGGVDEKKRRHHERNTAPETALAAPTGSSQNSDAGDWLGEMSSSRNSASWSHPTTAALAALHAPSSTLCFRARNVPSISIEAYLLRILRYCPASCEVFVSLLVYFDRMSKMGGQRGTDVQGAEMEKEGEGEDQHDKGRQSSNGSFTGSHVGDQSTETDSSGADGESPSFIGMRGFAIDSFNVHRLVIAGVTVASKFFSDVFYTNSRYAKVGGLPVHELNQLELQFLLLNDFKLMISLEEMQRYADQLLVYGRSASSGTTAALPSQLSSSKLNGHSRMPNASDKDASGKTAITQENDEGHGATQGNTASGSALAGSAMTTTAPDVHGDTPMNEA